MVNENKYTIKLCISQHVMTWDVLVKFQVTGKWSSLGVWQFLFASAMLVSRAQICYVKCVASFLD